MSGYPCGGVGEPCGPNNLPYFRPNNYASRGQTSKIVGNTFFPGCVTPNNLEGVNPSDHTQLYVSNEVLVEGRPPYQMASLRDMKSISTILLATGAVAADQGVSGAVVL